MILIKSSTYPILQAEVRVDRYWRQSVAVDKGIGWPVGLAACSVSSGETAVSCSSGRRLVSATSSSACCGPRSTRGHVDPTDAPNCQHTSAVKLTPAAPTEDHLMAHVT